MMRKIAAFSIIFLILAVSRIPAQTKTDSLKRIEEPVTFSSYFNPAFNFDDSFFSNELTLRRFNSKLLNDPSSIWLNARMQMNEMIYRETSAGNLQSNILNPLSQQYSATQNMKLFRSIVGAVSVGAVGYLAYQHLKKYGFLKRH